ncbi:MAG TPA: hypothetical protein VN949_00150 [Candidatus Limnocylindrales bacterium]|nr:hypothetical protein [Candidatus Limnocylindrales bacterium]
MLNRCDQCTTTKAMNYPYAAWRRILFVAVLVVIIVIAFAPATTQGTLFLRLSSLSTPSVISHIYIGFTEISLHEVGYVNSSICDACGWITISQSFPTVDLLSNLMIPPTVTSAPIHSGRYDEIRVSFSNSTVIIPGSQPIPISAPPRLSTNMTLPVPPGGVGDILLVVGFDYSTLFSGQPSLSFVLIRASAV